MEDIARDLSEPVEQVVRHNDTIPPTIDSVAGTKSDNAQADPRKQLEELLRRQQLKRKEQAANNPAGNS